jgi:hypothetical protein
MQMSQDSTLTSNDVADYFPEFQNSFGRVDMQIDIASAGDSTVIFSSDEDTPFTVNTPFLVSFKYAAGSSGRTWKTGFEAMFTIEYGIDLSTQSNKLYFKIEDPQYVQMDIKQDAVDILHEIDIFEEEVDRFMKDYTDMFNTIMFTGGQTLPVPDYMRMDFEFEDGAMYAEMDFADLD